MEESEIDEESQEEAKNASEISINYQDYEGNYETIAVSSPQGYEHQQQGPVKTKYYKQTYRTAWEHMPDFKGWLTGVPGEPTRAFCIYCQKTLHAHRLSLLKHTCTIRHQKAAQIHKIRKNKGLSNNMEASTIIFEGNSSQEMEGDENAIVEFTTVEVDEQDNNDKSDNEGDDDEDSTEIENIQIHYKKAARSTPAPVMNNLKPPISTHVLDTSRGQPVGGLQVSLYKLIDGRWTYVNEGITSPDGRFSNFLDRNDLSPGRYKLHFDVDRYFEIKKQESMYPFIEIVFDCRSSNEHYHVPLLLSPYGYSTYRGS